MTDAIGKALRMHDLLEERSFLLDTTLASSIGATPALENLENALRVCTDLFDGIIVNPGPLEHLASFLGGKYRAAVLVLTDWTNAYRGADFCLPVADVKRVEISGARDVMSLGGSAAVATFLLGFDDAFEAENVRSISLLLRECYECALPVFADIRPIGPKVSDLNFEDAVKLGTSFMMEAGADALILPRCGAEALKFIADWLTVPIIVRSDDLLGNEEAAKIFDQGVRGILFSEKILEAADYPDRIGRARGD